MLHKIAHKVHVPTGSGESQQGIAQGQAFLHGCKLADAAEFQYILILICVVCTPGLAVPFILAR